MEHLLNFTDEELLNYVLGYYRTTLQKNQEAKEFLMRKGLDDADAIKRFSFGFSDRSFGLTLPIKQLKAGKILRNRLTSLGLYRDSGHEHLRGSLTIPIQDLDGKVIEVYGYKINDGRLRKGTEIDLFLHDKPAGIFNLEIFKPNSEIILCASFLDAITFWCYGFRHVTTTYHDGIIHEDLLQAFKRFGTKRVIFAFPRMGNMGKRLEVACRQLVEMGIECFQVVFPAEVTVNQYAIKMHAPQESLANLIRHAIWLEDGKLKLIDDSEKEDLHIVSSTLDETLDREDGKSDLFEDSLSDDDESDELDDEILSELETDVASTPEPVPVLQAEPNHIVQSESPVIDYTKATPSPAVPQELLPEISEHEVRLKIGDRHYRIRGFTLSGNLASMKLNLFARKDRDDLFFSDKLDLYSHKQRMQFVNQAAGELSVKDEVIKRDLGKILLALEKLQEDHRNNALKVDTSRTLTNIETESAMGLLKDPNLLDRILADFEIAGVVGEEINKLCGYLSCVSRKLDKPLAVMIQSSSAAGKSSLMESILGFIPEEERVQFSAMTGQSLYYMGEQNLKHKILAIAEEEGASQASYALKLLQSEGVITIASTAKDANTGNLVTHQYRVEGPVMLFLTTTAIDIDEELLNRCLVLTVNESREQTQLIHQLQRHRRTLAGLQDKLNKSSIIYIHQNAQRLLKPYHVINPYAAQLTFTDHVTRTRRDHEKYLTLIDTIALLHQFQRPVKVIEHNGQPLHYIEVEKSDIEAANKIAAVVFGRTLDELPTITRKLLGVINDMVKSECKSQGIEQRVYRFSRKTLRDYSGWGNTQLKIHLKRLEEMEYVLVQKSGKWKQFEYELLYPLNEESVTNTQTGFMDVAQLNKDDIRSGQNPNRSASGRGVVGLRSDDKNPENNFSINHLPKTGRVLSEQEPLALENSHRNHAVGV